MTDAGQGGISGADLNIPGGIWAGWLRTARHSLSGRVEQKTPGLTGRLKDCFHAIPAGLNEFVHLNPTISDFIKGRAVFGCSCGTENGQKRNRTFGKTGFRQNCV